MHVTSRVITFEEYYTANTVSVDTDTHVPTGEIATKYGNTYSSFIITDYITDHRND